MTRLEWGKGEPLFDLGLDQGVLYLSDGAVPWNGLVGFDEKAIESLDVEHYFEGQRIHISQVLGEFEGSVSAYTYPDVFAEYNGYGDRDIYRRFSFSYRTMRGIDRYQIHIIYNVMVRDSSRGWSSRTASVDPSLFRWDLYGQAVPVLGARPSSHLTLEMTDPDLAQELEDILYGTETTEPRLPDPTEIVELYEARTNLRITYHGDGTYTATGSDDVLKVYSDGRFEIDAPTAFLVEEGIFVVNSY